MIKKYLSAIILFILLLALTCSSCSGPRQRADINTTESALPGKLPERGTPVNSFPKAEMVNVTQEIELISTCSYAQPYLEVAIHAVFTGPDGRTMTVPGFWDGKSTWKIRFAAPIEGEWNYEVICSNPEDDGLHGQKGTLIAEKYTGDNDLLIHGRPRVSSDKEDLTYGDGTPFFWLADTHWFGFSSRLSFTKSNSPEYDTMFQGTVDQRAEEGFTAFQAMIWVSGDNPNEGGSQWMSKWKKPAPEYWRNVDRRVEYIVGKGMVPVIGLDWGGALTPQNYEDYIRIVRYAVARYASYPIIWNLAGEYTNGTGFDPDWIECYGRLGQYISEIDAYGTLETLHSPYFKDKPSSDAFRGTEWFSFIMSEGGHSPTFDYYDNGSGSDYKYFYKEYKIYRESEPKLPWLEAEAKYEDIWEIPTDQTREIAYIAIMNGSFGYSYGSEGGWQDTWDDKDEFQTYWRDPTPWYKALNKIVGTTQLPVMKSFFTSLPYWDLNYDTKSVKWKNECPGDTVLRPTVNSTDDKRCVIIYYPMNNKEINVDTYPESTGNVLTGLNVDETYTARWFDVKTGEYTLISTAVRSDMKGRYELPWPEGLYENDCIFILTANSAPTIEEEYAKATVSEQEHITHPSSTGEKALPQPKTGR